MPEAPPIGARRIIQIGRALQLRIVRKVGHLDLRLYRASSDADVGDQASYWGTQAGFRLPLAVVPAIARALQELAE